jgi:eukaryotic translation initiation factor 2C
MRGYDKSTTLPARPKPCKLGTATKVGLNTFNVLEYPSQPVYSYEVRIGNGEEKRGLIKKVWESKEVQRAIGEDVIWDGNALAWSTRELRKEVRLVVDLDVDQGKPARPDKPNAHRITIRQTGRVQFDLLRSYLARKCDWHDGIYEAINFFDHLLRDGPSKRLTSIKRSFFQRGEKRFDLGGGVQAFKGAYQSLRITHGPSGPCLSVNVDVANGTFFNSGPLQDIAFHIAGCRNINEFIAACRQSKDGSRTAKALRRLSKLHVTTYHRGLDAPDAFCIDKVLRVSSRESKFKALDDKGKEVQTTVYDYFLKKYKVRLQYPDLPVVLMTKGKNTILPMEVLVVKENQRYPSKCDERQTANMIKFAVTPPAERWQAIEHGLRMLSWNTDRTLQKYGLKVSMSRAVVEARVLTPPKVQYGTGVANPGTSGRWDLKGKKFLQPNTAPLKSWSVTVISGKRGGKPDKSTVDHFVKEFVKIYKSHGGRVENANPPLNLGTGDDTGAIVTAAWNMAGTQSNARPQILVFILPDKDSVVYGRIKRSAECRYGVVSQCMQYAHVQKAQGQYISNVCMKFNAKLGGTTCRAIGPKSAGPLGSFTQSTMVIGADVSHAAPGQQTASMAAMTISMDAMGARYSAACETNGYRKEMIQTPQIKSMLEPHIKHWVSTVGQGRFPSRILYFRDGVAEQQYAHVLQQEVMDIKALLKSANPNANIPFVVVIAGKRHHVRFFPEKGDRNGNPLPGTLVDSGVTHPFENDFYLCSHAALKGTARPTHYHVILNEANMSNDELQTILYEQSYQYARATTPVSIHPAIYYAHIASGRASVHDPTWNKSVDGSPGETQPSQMTPTTPKFEDDSERLMPMPNVSGINSSMWFI